MEKIPFDVLDYIFGLLQPHPKSLIACSKALPVVSHIVERHRYRHIIIHAGFSDFTHSFEPSHLLKLLSESPGIANRVRVLQLECHQHNRDRMAPYLEQTASILPMFPALKCIMLYSRSRTFSWEEDLPQSFRTAVEGCLQLPTLQEVQVTNLSFPLSLLNNHANITRFSVFGASQIPESLDTPYPQLESLSVGMGIDDSYRVPFASWAKQHIHKLRSLAYDYSSDQSILELFEICSDTLNNLDLHLGRYISSGYYNLYDYDTGDDNPHDTLLPINLSSFPHLQQLTIRAEFFFEWDVPDLYRFSFLPAAVEIIKTASSLRNLTIEIFISDLWAAPLDDVDVSPLSDLVESSASFREIDLYIYSNCYSISRANILSLLADWDHGGGFIKLIEQGLVVVHPDKPAPTFLVDAYWNSDMASS